MPSRKTSNNRSPQELITFQHKAGEHAPALSKGETTLDTDIIRASGRHFIYIFQSGQKRNYLYDNNSNYYLIYIFFICDFFCKDGLVPLQCEKFGVYPQHVKNNTVFYHGFQT